MSNSDHSKGVYGVFYDIGCYIHFCTINIVQTVVVGGSFSPNKKTGSYHVTHLSLKYDKQHRNGRGMARGPDSVTIRCRVVLCTFQQPRSWLGNGYARHGADPVGRPVTF